MILSHRLTTVVWKRGIVLLLVVLAAAQTLSKARPAAAAETAAPTMRRGFYLHGCWKFNYPFAVRTWQRADYQHMFQLLKHLGFNTVMLWPVLEAVPAPLSAADRDALRAYREIIEDARHAGLECWLTQCANLTSQPEIRSQPWMQRSLWPHMKTVRLDDPKEAAAYFEHRAALMTILNNADAYVTIDGDPGGYPKAQPSDFLKVFLHDRQVLDRVGTHPKSQKLVPWIWCGWGTNGVWQEPIEPFVRTTLDELKRQMPEPWELLPGRSIREGHANGRINIGLTHEAGLIDRSTLMLYEIIEFEPTPPSAVLQFAEIRHVLKQELSASPASRGFFGNAQQPIMAIPNLYLFGRASADPPCLDRSDGAVLTDLARALGGPPELLVPAWSCLQLDLNHLASDLPAKLRATKLTGPLAADLPGGSARYLDILAGQVDSRLRLLRACRVKAQSPEQAALSIADATAALVDWWKVHRYVLTGESGEAFRWDFIHSSQYETLRHWCGKNVSDRDRVASLAVQEIVRRGLLDHPTATARMRELLW